MSEGSEQEYFFLGIIHPIKSLPKPSEIGITVRSEAV